MSADRLPADHPVDGPRDEHGHIIHGPAESPDWEHRYRGYAYRQLVATRDRMAAEVARDVNTGKLTGDDQARAEARLTSYNTLIESIDNLRKATS